MYTANVQQQGEWWIGWIKDIPGVNCQERTYDELLDSLRGCLKDILVFVGWVKRVILPTSLRTYIVPIPLR